MNLDNKLLINIYSDANFLALNILENLLSKKCLVNVITNDVKRWKERTSLIVNKSTFSILGESKINETYKSNYTIYCGGFLNKKDVYNDLRIFLSKTNIQNTKTLAILPFEVFNQNDNIDLAINNNLSIIYLGDLLGPRIDLESDLFLPLIINEILSNRNMSLGVGEVFYPIFISDAVKTITKWLFSFGPYGKEIFLLGSQTSGSIFWQENQRIVSEININYDNETAIRFIPKGYEIKTIYCNVRFALIETYKWLNSTKTKKNSFPKKPQRKIVIPKFLQPLIITLGMVCLVPILTLSISIGSFFISYREFLKGNDDNAISTILFGKTFSVLTKQESNFLSYIPILGRVYKEISFAGMLGEKASDVVIGIIPSVRISSELFNKVLGSDVYDPIILSQKLKSGLDSIYQGLSFLQIETQSESKNGLLLSKFVTSKINLERLRKVIIQTENLSDNLPNILGKDSRKTYLILFQNNMELRPTGGFIGSYGLITFDGGRMSDLTVSDVYSADGQLNGHVEPPLPIKNYLGEANWWLRDSNWDPDFPTSAKRAEWFLDKEVARKVDGVIAIDLSIVKDILKLTGPVFLPDFNLNITDTNLYEKTQSEVQNDFFPGTHKKASFLTALSRNLISVIGKLDGNKKSLFLMTFFNNLENRHIQIYLHDENLQNNLRSLAWDGSVLLSECKDSCYPDFIGVVEANLGVNKANYFIKRETTLDVKITPTEIVRHLTLNIKNSANPALALAGKYKVYVRLLIPDDSEIIEPSNLEIVEQKGRKEVGTLVEILGGQSKSIDFYWKSSFNNSQTSYYLINVRKQAGISDDPFVLTVDGKTVYNTNLTHDISWTKKF